MSAPIPSDRKAAASSEWRGGGAAVLAMAVVAATLTGPGQTIGVSVFIDHFVADLGLSRSQVSGAYLVGTLTGAMFLPFVGRFVDRRGVRAAQIVVGLLFGVALVNMSFVTGLLSLAIGFTGIRLLGQGSLSLVSNVTVALRFFRQRGAAMGIFSTASGALMGLMPVVLALVIVQVGWRNAWLVSAAVVVGLVVPIAWFGLRSLPTGTQSRTGEPVPRAEDGSYDRSEALRSRSFWILASVAGVSGMLGTALNFHQIDLLGEAGMSSTTAAAMFIPQIIGTAVSGLAVGFVADRVGTRYLPAVGMGLLVAALVMAAFVVPGLAVILYAVVLGAMGATVRTVTAILMPAWFGTAHLGAIQGLLTFFNVGASALGPLVLSLARDEFGAYRQAALILTALPIMALVFSLFQDRNRRPIVLA